MSVLLRKCPSCGHRFRVRVQSKRLVDKEEHTEKIVRDVVYLGGAGIGSSNVIPAGRTYDVEVPMVQEEFAVTLECEKCHHRWTEMVSRVEKEDQS